MNITILGQSLEVRDAIRAALDMSAESVHIQEEENPLTVFPADGQSGPIAGDADIIAMSHRLFQDINGGLAVSSLRAKRSKTVIISFVLNGEGDRPRLAMYAFIQHDGQYEQLAVRTSITIADLRDALSSIIASESA